MFLDRYSEYLDLSFAQQLAMRHALEDSIKRVSYDPAARPYEFYPVPRRPANGDERIILVNPYISFGRAVVTRVGVTTSAIAQRVDAGETASAVMEDYGLRADEFDESLAYEAAA